MDSAYEIIQPKLFKRIVAFIIDAACFGLLFVLLYISGNNNQSYQEKYVNYQEKLYEHGLILKEIDENNNIVYLPYTQEKYCEGQKDLVACTLSFNEYMETANKEFGEDEEAMNSFNSVIRHSLMISLFSSFIPFAIFYIIIPIILKNGQTIGKKITNIGVAHKESLKFKWYQTFLRALVSYMFEISLIFVFIGFTGNTTALISFLLITLINFILFVFNKNHCLIHDLISSAVVCDIKLTVLFPSLEDKKKYIAKH